jgi:sialic acid synthase SpsE
VDFTIGDKEVGQGYFPYIAMEVGGTMSGLVSAVRLAHVAADAGADALKVQILDPDSLVGGNPMVQFTDATGNKREEPQKDALNRRFLPKEGWLALGQVCRERGIDLIATVDCFESLVVAVEAGAAAVKICSGDITNLGLIKEVAGHEGRNGHLPILFDTGHAELGELERAVDTALDVGARVMVHHVAGGYPATRVNLAQIPSLIAMFPDVAIGYSSHVDNWHVDAAAVALGAVMIEKNLTLDRSKAGPEQSTAVEPAQARQFVCAMLDVWGSLGKPRKRISSGERKGRAAARRCAWTRYDLAAGLRIKREDIVYRRPAVENGFEPQDEAHLVGRRAATRISGPILKEYLA